MVMLPMTLGDPYPLKTTPISTFYVAFHIFVVGKPWNFKFGGQVDHTKSSWCHCHFIISCFTKSGIGSAFLVPAYAGKVAIKWVWLIDWLIHWFIDWNLAEFYVFDPCLQWAIAGVCRSWESVHWKLADMVHVTTVRTGARHFQVQPLSYYISYSYLLTYLLTYLVDSAMVHQPWHSFVTPKLTISSRPFNPLSTFLLCLRFGFGWPFCSFTNHIYLLTQLFT